MKYFIDGTRLRACYEEDRILTYVDIAKVKLEESEYYEGGGYATRKGILFVGIQLANSEKLRWECFEFVDIPKFTKEHPQGLLFINGELVDKVYIELQEGEKLVKYHVANGWKNMEVTERAYDEYWETTGRGYTSLDKKGDKNE